MPLSSRSAYGETRNSQYSRSKYSGRPSELRRVLAFLGPLGRELKLYLAPPTHGLEMHAIKTSLFFNPASFILQFDLRSSCPGDADGLVAHSTIMQISCVQTQTIQQYSLDTGPGGSECCYVPAARNAALACAAAGV